MIPGNSFSVEVSVHQGCAIETKVFNGYTFTKVFFPKLEKFGYVVPDQLKGYKKESGKLGENVWPFDFGGG